MGNSVSRSPDKHVFHKELQIINELVHGIINEKDIFKSSNYNFLSRDVCKNYQVVFEEELQKHLKINIQELGTTLYIIPKDDNERLTKLNMTKSQVCEKISTHYLKILYVLCLIKYVYNLEHHGDLSIGGIIMRNIRVLDDIMEINFCDQAHKDYRGYMGPKGKEANHIKSQIDPFKVDFSRLEGFKFFIDYFLDSSEASAFLGILKAILARSTKGKVSSTICGFVKDRQLNKDDIKELELLYTSRFQGKLNCQMGGSLNMRIFVNKDNPILAKDLCLAPRKIIIKTSSKEGHEVVTSYHTLKENYNKNIKKLYNILNKFIEKRNGYYSLRDIDKKTLDSIIQEVKLNIKVFFLQSIIDYQNLLDKAKLIPNINTI